MKRIIITIIIAIQIVFLFDFTVSAQWLENGSSIVYTDDQVGIGISTPYEYTNLDIRENLTYGYKICGYGLNTATGGTFTGESYFKFGETTSWGSYGYGIGVNAYTNNVTLLKNTLSNKTALALGGSLGVNIIDPIPEDKKSVGCYYIAGVRAYLNGSITRYPTNGVVTAVLGYDYIKGTNTWAGYFDGNLGVNGKIKATEVKIQTLPWSDFVFKKDFKLRSISSLEEYIQENGHLPEMPNEKEIQDNGLNLGEMDAKLLQKIEELTLYVIELKNENDKLKARMELLEATK